MLSNFFKKAKPKEDSLSDRNNQVEADNQTYSLLLRHGADPHKEHQIDFFFKGDQNDLELLEKELANQGYAKMETEESSTLLVRQQMKLELMKSGLIINSLESLARKYGASFDGWGAVARK